jgi:pre-mRNA-processing factor 19
MTARSAELSKERKKRQAPSTLVTEEDLKEFDVLSSNPTHKASAPGITCIDIHTTQELIVTGGVDKNVVVFDRTHSKIANTLTHHTKRVNEVQFHPSKDVILSCAADKTAVAWAKTGNDYHSSHVIKAHSDDVTSLSLHATGDFWVTASLDKTWAFHDLNTGATLAQVQADAGLTTTRFHPDGLILGTGTENSTVKIWDAKTLKNVASFEGHKGKLVDLNFSENGYYLATTAEDNVVKLWDLRKLSNFHSLNLPEDFSVSSLSWDYSGTYLAVAGKDIRVFVGKAR